WPALMSQKARRLTSSFWLAPVPIWTASFLHLAAYAAGLKWLTQSIARRLRMRLLPSRYASRTRQFRHAQSKKSPIVDPDPVCSAGLVRGVCRQGAIRTDAGSGKEIPETA